MLNRVETMFDNMELMLNKLKKHSYEINMNDFLEKNDPFFSEMKELMERQEKTAEEISQAFVLAVKNRFEEKGRIKGRRQTDMNMFMIYYVFPAILKRLGGQAVPMADTLCRVWNSSFKGTNIRYTDYDTLYHSFNEKILGIF